MTTHAPPSTPLDRWYAAVRTHDVAAVEASIAEDAVFESPAVHRPKAGRALVATYLRAAMHVLGDPSFRYTGEWLGERSAVLEFELVLDGVEVNGVDLIRWNARGEIAHFKVMIRPFKALETVIARMRGRLEAAPS